jgi:hypothetical protein
MKEDSAKTIQKMVVSKIILNTRQRNPLILVSADKLILTLLFNGVGPINSCMGYLCVYVLEK